MARARAADSGTMTAARLHGPRDLRVERVPRPGAPGRGEVLLRVKSTGICGSDLHSYHDARIGDTAVTAPLILGHEFSAVVHAVGRDAFDGAHRPLAPGTRVAVDPAQPCHRCEFCERGHPNLCRLLAFCGNYPYGGSFCEYMVMPARCCFPVPASLDDAEAALLEPLGVALHAVDLAGIRVGDSAAIIGMGPIGLLVLQLARLAGADPVFATDTLAWRLARARKYGAVPIRADRDDAVRRIQKDTGGRGVDVAIEAAWADQSVADAAEMARLGGRVVIVGIPGDDRMAMKASTARRKGLTIVLSRRMKHTYPRAIRLATEGRVDLAGLVTHRFPLRRVAEAFAINAAYQDRVVKIMIDS
jgi:L-iditol 2-dehydrogenase